MVFVAVFVRVIVLVDGSPLIAIANTVAFSSLRDGAVSDLILQAIKSSTMFNEVSLHIAH